MTRDEEEEGVMMCHHTKLVLSGPNSTSPSVGCRWLFVVVEGRKQCVGVLFFFVSHLAYGGEGNPTSDMTN